MAIVERVSSSELKTRDIVRDGVRHFVIVSKSGSTWKLLYRTDREKFRGVWTHTGKIGPTELTQINAWLSRHKMGQVFPGVRQIVLYEMH